MFELQDWGICINCKKIFPFSSIEREISYYIKTISNYKIIENSREIISPKELDIYLPEISFAIEYNGLYFHSNEFKKKDDHLLKTLLCERKNIKLIHIFADEWEYQKDIVKSIIKHAINKTENKILARNCKVEEISQIEEKDFFNRTHISGYKPSEKSLCLTYNGNIVCAISFKKPWNVSENYKDCVEISRFSNELNTFVNGGFSKLLEHSKSYLIEQGYKKLLSYADRRFSNGNLYRQTKFEFIGETDVGFWYTDFLEKFN